MKYLTRTAIFKSCDFHNLLIKACGKVGKVEKVDSDGDVVVQFGQQVWVYSPACLIPAPGQKIDQLTSKGLPDLSASMRRKAESSG